MLAVLRLFGARPRVTDPELTPAVHAQLIGKLFRSRSSVLLSSAIGTALMGGASAYRTGDAWLALLTGITAAAILSIALVLKLYRARAAEADLALALRLERHFACAACAASAGIGAMTTWGLVANDDMSAHLMLIALALSAASVVVRNYFRPAIVRIQLLVLIAPPSLALALRDEPFYWLLSLGSLVTAFNMTKIAESLFGEVRDGLVSQAELKTQYVRFDAALANMAQGLSMFDSHHRLLVCNKRYLEIYGFDPAVVQPGITLKALLAHSIDQGNHKGIPLDDLHAIFIRNLATSEASISLNELATGRTISIAHEPMQGGGWVATHEDISERRAAEAKIAYLARHDVLTDLPNRLTFREKLEEALARVRRGKQVAVLCLDLDRFKPVNDTLGHAAGDRLLSQAAIRIQACVQDADTVARLGGDEFAVIEAASPQPTGAAALAERIIDALSAPFDIDGHQISIGSSVGISIAPDDSCGPDQLLRNADLALYRAKSEGRGQHRFFASEMDDRMKERRELELDLRSALMEGEFRLVYQPLVTIETGRISGFEALLRWDNPRRGLVMPDDFIPLAEESGLISKIGDWVLREACSAAATWPAGIRVAVNLSPAQFRSGNLLNCVMMALSSSGLDAERLELEITEGVLLADSDRTTSTLHNLRDLGVRIAMDDFGSGYSSLSYLRSFPFDKIKIDRTFVRDILADKEALAIVRAIMDLGRSLGMTTTAEGIETVEQLERLREQGCSEAQGFLLGRPMPAESVLEMLNGSGAGRRGQAA